MAKLLKTTYPFPKRNDFESNDIEAYFEASDIAINAISEKRLFRWPIADGYAYYYVVSFVPLVLQHIPYGGAYVYKLPYNYIRGLRTIDVRNTINADCKKQRR